MINPQATPVALPVMFPGACRPSARPLVSRLLLFSVWLVVVSGCSNSPQPADAPERRPSATASVAAPAAVASIAPSASIALPATGSVNSPLATLSAPDLLAHARAAESDKRLYQPAGNSAMEYYLELRNRTPNDTRVLQALQDLFPYAMIATEQNLKKGDEPGRIEAVRLLGLLERADPNAPSLPRLREMVRTEAAVEIAAKAAADKKIADALLKKTADDQAKVKAAEAAAALAAPPKEAARPPVEKPATEKAAIEKPAPAFVSEPPTPNHASEPVSKPTHVGFPAALSSPQPVYPREALRDGLSGEVTVTFTVNTDGTVGSASVVSSAPRRVFDSAALEAIKKWRFEAPLAPVTGRRTFAFNPGT